MAAAICERTAAPKGPRLSRTYHGGPAAKINEMFACLEDGSQHGSSSSVSKSRSGIGGNDSITKVTGGGEASRAIKAIIRPSTKHAIRRALALSMRCPDKRSDNGTRRTDCEPFCCERVALAELDRITVRVARHGESSRAHVRDEILGLLATHASSCHWQDRSGAEICAQWTVHDSLPGSLVPKTISTQGVDGAAIFYI